MKRFRCIHCGDRFDLTGEDLQNFQEGLYMNDPDCCDDCFDNVNYHDYDYGCDEYSDAAPGL
jgi:hypothetical protein